MLKCLLAEFYSSTGYKAEIFEKAKFDIEAMDKRWEEIFYFPIKDDSAGCWEITECEVEPLFEISVDDECWHWQIGRRLWFNDHYKLLYTESGEANDLEKALELALDAFSNMGTEFEVTELEDIDDTL